MSASNKRLNSRLTGRAYLEAGKITKANKDFRFASNAPFETLVSMDRETARGRARWLEDNNAIMDNIDNAILNNVFGKGIHLNTQSKKIQTAWNKFIANADRTGRLDFYDICRVILKRRMVDGEIFIQMIDTKEGLKLSLIESDRVGTSDNKLGMKLDSATGEVIEYYFREVSTGNSFTNKVTTIKASDVINYFICHRPTQYRGITEYSQVILDIKNLMAYNTATIESKRASANVAYAIKTTGGFGSFGGTIDDDNEMLHEVNGSAVYYLGMGEEITTLNQKGEGANYRDFTESAIRGIAVGRNISYELANRDYSKVNFSSAKASILQDYRRFDADQMHFTKYFLNIVYKRWFELEKFRGNITGEYKEPEWNYPKREFVDPIKDMKEIEKKLELNMTSLSDIVKETSGRDLEDVLKQKQKDDELIAKYIKEDEAPAKTIEEE